MSEEVAKALQQGVEEDLLPAAEDAAKSVGNAIGSVASGADAAANDVESTESDLTNEINSVKEKPPALSTGSAAASEPSKITEVLSGNDGEPLSTKSPSSFLHSDEDIPGAGPGTKRLGSLSESDVTRDENGLITHVGGQPADEYLNSLSKERAGLYRAAKDDGSFPRSQQGNCIATGLDRRTGMVYEGINGPRTDVIPESELHSTLQGNLDDMRANGPYTWRDGTGGHDVPFHDSVLGHAEVKATNQALFDRQAANLPTDKGSLGELMMSPYQQFIRGGRPAEFCPNCDGVLDGVVSTTGRLTQ